MSILVGTVYVDYSEFANIMGRKMDDSQSSSDFVHLKPLFLKAFSYIDSKNCVHLAFLDDIFVRFASDLKLLRLRGRLYPKAGAGGYRDVQEVRSTAKRSGTKASHEDT